MNRLSKYASSPKVECVACLVTALLLASAPFWQGYVSDAILGGRYGSTKGNGPQRYVSDFEMGVIMFEVMIAPAFVGFAIGALTRSKAGWGIAGVALPAFLVIVLLFDAFLHR